MQAADELIREIVDRSQIPSERKRHAVLRELRAHVEESVIAGREAGRSDDEVVREVLDGFGDPDRVAESFAWIYRHERAGMRVAVFLLSTLMVASALAVAILAVQAGMAAGFGAPVRRVIASRHTVIESLDILSTVAVYVGFVSIERLFDRRGFQKAVAVAALTWTLVAWGTAVANVHAPFVTFGLVGGIFLRSIQVFVKSSLVRTGMAAVCFAAAGMLLFHARLSVVQCTSWLAMGAGYQLMAVLAPRVSDRVRDGLQRI
jgi:hypothetical protein